jgi:glutamate racemase
VSAAEDAIAVFDSGIGGLTVLSSLARGFPQENFVYLGDTARLPYGDKSPATILKYVQQNVRFLKTLSLKAVIIACNSASSVVLEQTRLDGLPLFNVIEPGAALAWQSSTNKRIAVMGTQATIRQGAYTTKLKAQAAALGQDVHVEAIACPLLVPLVEQGWFEDPITNLVLYRYLHSLRQLDIDTLIMGCTHYPLLKAAIGRVVGAGVTLVHSGEAMVRTLKNADLAWRPPASPPRRLRLLTTDLSPQFHKLAQHILHGLEFGGAECVEI